MRYQVSMRVGTLQHKKIGCGFGGCPAVKSFCTAYSYEPAFAAVMTQKTSQINGDYVITTNEKPYGRK